MKTTTYPIDKEDIFKEIFPFLVEYGLENVSIREMCRGTGVARASLYYWFEDKASIICQATEYGLKKVTGEIFDYVFSSIDDLKSFFENCLDRISLYKKELRFIYQMVASPKYGERLRKDSKYFKSMYDKYAVKLSEYLNYDIDKVKPIVYLLVSSILDYVVWDDKENSQAEIDFIYSILPKVMDTANK